MITETGARVWRPGWDGFNTGQGNNKGQGNSSGSSQVRSGDGGDGDGGDRMVMITFVSRHWGWLCQLREELRGCARYGSQVVLWEQGEARLGFFATMLEVCEEYLAEGERLDGAIRRWEEDFDEDFGEFVDDYLGFWRRSGAGMGLTKAGVTEITKLMLNFAETVMKVYAGHERTREVEDFFKNVAEAGEEEEECAGEVEEEEGEVEDEEAFSSEVDEEAGEEEEESAGEDEEEEGEVEDEEAGEEEEEEEEEEAFSEKTYYGEVEDEEAGEEETEEKEERAGEEEDEEGEVEDEEVGEEEGYGSEEKRGRCRKRRRRERVTGVMAVGRVGRVGCTARGRLHVRWLRQQKRSGQLAAWKGRRKRVHAVGRLGCTVRGRGPRVRGRRPAEGALGYGGTERACGPGVRARRCYTSINTGSMTCSSIRCYGLVASYGFVRGFWSRTRKGVLGYGFVRQGVG